MRSLAVRVVGGAVVLGLVVSLAVTATAQKRGFHVHPVEYNLALWKTWLDK